MDKVSPHLNEVIFCTFSFLKQTQHVASLGKSVLDLKNNTLTKQSRLKLFPLVHSLLTLVLQISHSNLYAVYFQKCSVVLYYKLLFTIQCTQQCSTGSVFAQGHFNTICSHLRVAASDNSSIKLLLFIFTVQETLYFACF